MADEKMKAPEIEPPKAMPGVKLMLSDMAAGYVYALTEHSSVKGKAIDIAHEVRSALRDAMGARLGDILKTEFRIEP